MQKLLLANSKNFAVLQKKYTTQAPTIILTVTVILQ